VQGDYQRCFAEATSAMTSEQLLSTWPAAFAAESDGGCPVFVLQPGQQRLPLNGPKFCKGGCP